MTSHKPQKNINFPVWERARVQDNFVIHLDVLLIYPDYGLFRVGDLSYILLPLAHLYQNIPEYLLTHELQRTL